MNLETIAVSRQYVETQALEMINKAVTSNNNKDLNLEESIRLFWPSVTRMPSAFIVLKDGAFQYCSDHPTTTRRLMSEEGFSEYSAGHDYWNRENRQRYLKLLYSTYPSGTQYLAGVGIVTIDHDSNFGIGDHDIRSITVQSRVYTFSEKAEMMVPYKALQTLGAPDPEAYIRERLKEKDEVMIESVINNYRHMRCEFAT